MRLVATYSKGNGKFRRKMKLYFPNHDEFEAKTLELKDEGWHLTSYTQVER